MIGWWAMGWWAAVGCGPTPNPEPPPADPVPTERVAKAKAKAKARRAEGSGTAEIVKPAERDPAYAEARCNDGSPFAYTVRAADPHLWVVNVSGGFFCDDDRANCSDRKRRLTTTLAGADGTTTSMKRGGVFSQRPAVNPDFAAATHVDAHYCSSDLWFGDSTQRRPTTGDPDQGWYFSGRENMTTLFTALQSISGLDDAHPDTRVLLVGTSAGGAGVMGNLDAIAAGLPATTARRGLKVVLDGSWLPSVPVDDRFPDADRWGPAHPTCAAGFDSEDPVACVLGPYWWPLVEASGVPVLVQISGLDKTQTPVFGIKTPDDQAAWQQRIRTSLEPLPWVFSGGHAYHVVAIDETLFGKGPQGKTFQQVLGRFWRDEAPEQIFFRYP